MKNNILDEDDFLIEYCEKKDLKGLTHHYYDVFNYNKTIKVSEYKHYFKYREKFKSLTPGKLEKVFGKDFVRHFEIAYQIWLLEEQ